MIGKTGKGASLTGDHDWQGDHDWRTFLRADFAANVFKSVAARPIRLMLLAAVAAPLAKT